MTTLLLLYIAFGNICLTHTLQGCHNVSNSPWFLVFSFESQFWFFWFQGTLRVLLVLLHDFPEFLCDYHYGFCDVIPPNCIQLRNLILSAFPRNMRLPDPFTPNLKVEVCLVSHTCTTRVTFCPFFFGHSLTKCFSSTLPSAGGHAERDQHCSPYTHQLHGRHAVSVQEGPGLVPEDAITSHFLIWAAQQPAGTINADVS